MIPIMAIEWTRRGSYMISEPVWVVNRVGRLTFQGGDRGGKLRFQSDHGSDEDSIPRFIDKFESWHAAKEHAENIAEPIKPQEN